MFFWVLSRKLGSCVFWVCSKSFLRRGHDNVHVMFLGEIHNVAAGRRKMLKKTIILIVLFGLFIVSNAIAGPFGLEMGMPLKEIGGEPEKISHGKYRLTNVPKPHSAFEAYVVQVAPKGGLCWIKAIGKDIRTSSYGHELKSAFSDMEERLESAYGKHKKMDILFSGSIWDEPRDWMMSLIKKERILASVWDESKGSNLPSDLKKIGLIASPSARDKGYISIEYSFTNEDSCEAELAAQEDDAL